MINKSFFSKVFPELNKAIDAVIYIYMGFVFVVSMNLNPEIKKYSNAFALVVMALIGIYVLTKDFKGILNRFTVMFGIYTAYCLLSILWSADRAISIERSTTVLKIFIVCALIYYYITTERKTEMLIHSIYIGGISLLVFTIVYYGPKGYLSGMISGKRMGYDFADANDMGRALMYTSIIGLYYTFYEKRWWNIFISALSAFVSVGTGSRIAIIIFIVGLFCLFFFYFTGKKRILGIGAFIVLAGIGFALLYLPAFESMRIRLLGMLGQLAGETDADISTIYRIMFARAGIEQFLKTPILGLGIGTSNVILMRALNTVSYLHNNFIEMLACGGIVGFIVFYALHGTIILKNIKPALKRNTKSVLSITLILMILAQDVANVDYYEKITLILITYMFCALEQQEDK